MVENNAHVLYKFYVLKKYFNKNFSSMKIKLLQIVHTKWQNSHFLHWEYPIVKT